MVIANNPYTQGYVAPATTVKNIRLQLELRPKRSDHSIVKYVVYTVYLLDLTYVCMMSMLCLGSDHNHPRSGCSITEQHLGNYTALSVGYCDTSHSMGFGVDCNIYIYRYSRTSVIYYSYVLAICSRTSLTM